MAISLRTFLPASMVLAAVTALLAPLTLRAAPHSGQGYTPKPFVPVDLPAETVLTPRTPSKGPAGIFARHCFWDSLQSDLAFASDDASVGVRIDRVPRETNFEVEFLIRILSRAAKFITNGSTATGSSTPSSHTLPTGLQRVYVRGRALTNKDGFARLSSDQNVDWRLVSATVRRK